MRKTVLVIGGCDAEFSTGDRVGVVTKLSYKGMINKSWEGQLATESFHRTDTGSSNSFYFSVRDPAVKDALDAAMRRGEPVKVTYRQVVLNSGCTQDSDYTIVGVEPAAKQRAKD